MSFANPYNFVSIDENNIERKPHEIQGEYNGKITCRIRFLNNFITAGENNGWEKKQLKINGKVGIQAPSLKGLFRSTAEAISNSCISMMSDKYQYRLMSGMPAGTLRSGVVYKIESKGGKDNLVFDQKKLVNKNALIESCDSKKGLCLCCMLFGTSAKDDEKGEESFTFKGKVRVLDAIYSGIYENNKIINADPIITKYLRKHSLSNPKNHHENYYLNGSNIKGRKFYYHHKNDGLLDKKQEGTILIDTVKKDAVFEFPIYFDNLTKEEYGLLLTTLELEPGLGHKIGMGKPLGLGSCVIDVREIVEFSKNRYLSIDNSGEIYNYEKNNILDRKIAIKKEWKKVFPNDLRCILTIDNGFTIRYPDKRSGEFRKLFHKSCEDFDGKPIKPPTSAKVSPSNPAAAPSKDSYGKSKLIY